MIYLLASVLIVVINVVPSFMPPTWTVLSFVYIQFEVNLLLLTLIGALSSSVGRLMLARISGKASRKILSEEIVENLNFLGNKIRSSPKTSFLAALIWALSPIASNYLFIAVGSTKSRMRYVISGFFLGRLVSYFSLAYTSSLVFEGLEDMFLNNILDWKKLVLNLVGFVFLFVYLLLDWRTLILKRKIRFHRKLFR